MTNQKTYHYVYKVTNLINSKIYIGVHSTNNLEDGYMGSGKRLWLAFNKYGQNSFKKEALKFFTTRRNALSYEREIVNDDFILREDTYNMCLGGTGGGWLGMTTVKDKNDNIQSVSINDPRYLSGELVGIAAKTVTVQDGDREFMSISKEDFDNDPNLFGNRKGWMNTKDRNGNIVPIKTDDPRRLTGELTSINTKMVVARDKNGSNLRVPTDDPRYLNGDLIGRFTNMVPVKDKDGNTFSVSVDDPKYLSGELVHTSTGIPPSNKGKKLFTNGTIKKYFFVDSEEIPKDFWKIV